MKKINYKILISLSIVALTLFTSFNASSQTRLPDGTIVYPNGSKQLPTGKVIYPGNNTTTNNGGILGSIFGSNKNRVRTMADGSIIYPDGTRKYPDGTIVYPNGQVYNPNVANYPTTYPENNSNRRRDHYYDNDIYNNRHDHDRDDYKHHDRDDRNYQYNNNQSSTHTVRDHDDRRDSHDGVNHYRK